MSSPSALQSQSVSPWNWTGGSEDQKRWREKVEALAAWAIGPYKAAFGNETLTIAVVTPTVERREQLRAWTHQELTRIEWAALGQIFLFTCADPVATSPQTFFFGRCWYEPVKPEPVSILIPPTLPQPAGQAAPGAGPLIKEVWRAQG